MEGTERKEKQTRQRGDYGRLKRFALSDGCSSPSPESFQTI